MSVSEFISRPVPGTPSFDGLWEFAGRWRMGGGPRVRSICKFVLYLLVCYVLSSMIAHGLWVHLRCRKTQTHLLYEVLDEWRREGRAMESDHIVLRRQRLELLSRRGVAFTLERYGADCFWAMTNNSWFFGEEIVVSPTRVMLLSDHFGLPKR